MGGPVQPPSVRGWRPVCTRDLGSLLVPCWCWGWGGGLVLWWQRWYSRLYHYWIGSDAVTSISNIVVISVAVRGDIIMIAIVVGWCWFGCSYHGGIIVIGSFNLFGSHWHCCWYSHYQCFCCCSWWYCHNWYCCVNDSFTIVVWLDMVLLVLSLLVLFLLLIFLVLALSLFCYC